MKAAKTGQKDRWSNVYKDDPEFFGQGQSGFAEMALARFRAGDAGTVLEQGCGQGRDTAYFAENGLQVTALDYSEVSVSATDALATQAGFSDSVTTLAHDVRQPLPFPDNSFDAFYSHMLLCMELSADEIAFALGEIHRVIKEGGLVLYSVRSVHDSYFRKGVHLCQNMYEAGGFVVHFFSEQMIKQLAGGFDVISIDRLEEGPQPRDLFAVVMSKSGLVYESRLSDAFQSEDSLGSLIEIGQPPGKT